MKARPSRVVAIGIVLFLVSARLPAAEAPAAEKESKFLRFVDDNDGGGKLEAAIVTYTDAKGVTVHLVSAVHVGEKQYYDDLSKTFQKYDALLYEMVKPKDAGAPAPGQKSESLISMFQRGLRDVLELEFQLDGIDYRAKNFVHADLDAETFNRLQEERGESMIILMLRQILNEMSKPQANVPEISPFELLMAFLSPDSARHFKLILAKQFEDIESKVAGLEGPNGSVILTERNKAAIRVLKETIASGKKEIGIFYGAAHMADMEKRIKEMGFNKVSTEWRVAWDMTPKEGDVIVKVKKKPQGEPEPIKN